MEANKALIDEERIDQITEIGLIDGGEWADVLAVSYGPGDTTIRLRFEQSGNRQQCGLPEGTTLVETLDLMSEVMYAGAIVAGRPYDQKPPVIIYRGHQARKWVNRLLAEAKRAAKEAQGSGLMPEIVGNGKAIPRLFVEIPGEPNHRFN